MKKLLALSLSIAIISATFVGCGKTETPENPAPASSEKTQSQDSSSEVASEASTDSSKPFVRGEWNNNEYKSEFINIAFTLPETWVKATDEEILQMMNLGKELLDDKTKMKAELSKKQTVNDFLISNPVTQMNIQLVAENLEKSIGGTLIQPEQYAEILKGQLAGITAMTYVPGETSKKTIGGQEYMLVPLTIKEQEGLHQDYLFKREGNYMITFVTTYMEKDVAEYNTFIDSIKPIA